MSTVGVGIRGTSELDLEAALREGQVRLSNVPLSTKSLKNDAIMTQEIMLVMCYSSKVLGPIHMPLVDLSFCFSRPRGYLRASRSTPKTVPSARQMRANYIPTYRSYSAQAERRSTDLQCLRAVYVSVVVCRRTHMYTGTCSPIACPQKPSQIPMSMSNARIYTMHAYIAPSTAKPG